MKNIDIGWMAGLIEGEGCISWNETPQIQICMTDRDIIERVVKIFGSNLCGPYDKGPVNKTAWSTSIAGAKAAGWLMTVFTLLGDRRKVKTKEVLAKWKNRGPTRGKYSERCVRGHLYDGYSSGQRTCSECVCIRYTAKKTRVQSVGTTPAKS